MPSVRGGAFFEMTLDTYYAKGVTLAPYRRRYEPQTVAMGIIFDYGLRLVLAW